MIAERQHEDEVLLRRYLLGQTSEEEQLMLEQRLLSDQEYFDQLLRSEEELTDEYARNEMVGHDRKRFEEYFLSSPERREGVAFAQALNRYLSKHKQQVPATPGLFSRWPVSMQVALMAAMVILVAALGLMLRMNMQLRKQAEQDRSQRAQVEQQAMILTRQTDQQREQLKQMEEELHRQGDSDLVSLVLSPGLSRDGNPTATLNLASGIHRVQFDLKIEDGSYRRYHAELQTVEGTIVWSQDNLQAHRTGQHQAVEMILPAALLTRSDYLIMLTGITPTGTSDKIGTYYFNVIKK
jgi:type II secretory pathway pseudopilin PulG